MPTTEQKIVAQPIKRGSAEQAILKRIYPLGQMQVTASSDSGRTRIEPAVRLRDIPQPAGFASADQPRLGEFAVGVAQPHAHQNLAGLIYLEPPIGQRPPPQRKAGRLPRPRKVREPLHHATSGSIKPIIRPGALRKSLRDSMRRFTGHLSSAFRNRAQWPRLTCDELR